MSHHCRTNVTRANTLPVQEEILKTKFCTYFAAGRCSRGSACSFAHNADELRPKVNLFKTRPCAAFVRKGSCFEGDECRFAHGKDDLRSALAWHEGGKGEPSSADARSVEVPAAAAEVAADSAKCDWPQVNEDVPRPLEGSPQAFWQSLATHMSRLEQQNGGILAIVMPVQLNPASGLASADGARQCSTEMPVAAASGVDSTRKAFLAAAPPTLVQSSASSCAQATRPQLTLYDKMPLSEMRDGSAAHGRRCASPESDFYFEGHTPRSRGGNTPLRERWTSDVSSPECTFQTLDRTSWKSPETPHDQCDIFANRTDSSLSWSSEEHDMDRVFEKHTFIHVAPVSPSPTSRRSRSSPCAPGWARA